MRGFWYMLEAMIAGLIILGFVLLIGKTMFPATRGFSIAEVGYNEIMRLDDAGIMAQYIDSMDFENISSRINVPGYFHSLEICDNAGNCRGKRPANKTVWVSTYISAGGNHYAPVIIKLYLWRKE